MDKLCGQCGERKPLDAFAKCSRERDGKQSACRECRGKYTRDWYRRNHAKARARTNTWRETHREHVNANSRRWARLNSEKYNDVKRQSRYGITPVVYRSILERQEFRCAICRRHRADTEKAFHVDHDHGCCAGERSCGGCVRGLLCNRCNRALGWFSDSVELLEAALVYLRTFATHGTSSCDHMGGGERGQ